MGLMSLYRQATAVMLICIIALTPANPQLESGQLIKTDSCTCPEGVVTYQCIINGTDPGGFTIWNRNAFNCQSNNILLRHSLFDGQTGAFGSCNNGIISGQSLGVSEGNVYTSQLQVNLTSSSRSNLIGTTVWCVYSPDGSTNIVINSTTITITDPLPPPNDIQLTDVKLNELTFNWSSVQSDCLTLQYELQSNCGTCTNNPNVLTSAICLFELSAVSNGVCNFAVQSIVCGNIIGSLSSPVTVTLKVPDSPMIQSAVPTYNIEGQLIKVELNFTDMDSFNISNMVDGSALFYTVNFIDSSAVVCNSSNVSASACTKSVCTVPPVILTSCSRTGTIRVAVSAFNLLGNGPDCSIKIASTNQYVEVRFESAERIVCTFRDQQGNPNKSCDLAYGPCRQNKNLNMTIRGTVSSSEIVIIDFPTQLSTSGYCYFIEANNGTFSLLVEGMFDNNKDQKNANTAVIVGILVPLLILSAITVATILIVIFWKPWKRRRKAITSTNDQESEVLLEQVDTARLEYEDVSAHIFFNIKNKLEELIEALELLSKIINIKNIKISPFNFESDNFDDISSEKRICIECDDDVTNEQKAQLEALPKLGLPETRKIYIEATSEQVIKDKGKSKHLLRKITVDLQDKQGALCGLLQTVQSTEGCQHISITDIIHQSVKGRDERKRVTIKILPQLPENWRDWFDVNKSRCEYILPEEGETSD